MRTTISIDEKILKESRAKALKEGVSLAAYIEDALRMRLRKRPARPKARRVKLVTFRGRGLFPGLDLDDSAGLLDAMDGDNAPVRR